MAADTKHIFSQSGPSFLTVVNWNDQHHRRSVAASLVQGAYVHEHDRQKNRHGLEALGPPWWQSFNFRLVHDLVDKHDDSYFGAVFEFINVDHHRSGSGGLSPPQYVVAFRGTIKKSGTWEQDFKLNLLLAFNLLQKTSRSQMGFESACRFVQQNGNVWLAGHSLGSALALVVGRKMVRYVGARLETYLFNPPFASPPIERLANSVLTAGLAAAFRQDGDDDPFIALSTWIPNLFINPSDPICSGFIAYFQHREDMESIGAGGNERLATNTSVRTMLLSAAGETDCEALRLIPSAFLTINVAPSNIFKNDHGISQWWRPSPDVQFHYKFHQYK